MIFIGKKQDLKLFKTQQDSPSSSIMAESSSASSSLYGSDSIYKSKVPKRKGTPYIIIIIIIIIIILLK
jgi:hypothetical protein